MINAATAKVTHGGKDHKNMIAAAMCDGGEHHEIMVTAAEGESL